MPFTSEELILSRITQDQLDAMKGDEGEKLALAIADVDALITGATGIEPEAAAGDNHRILSSIASRIVIWTLSGNVQGLGEGESSRRRKDYEDAWDEIERIRSGELTLTVPSTTTVATVSCLPRRFTEY